MGGPTERLLAWMRDLYGGRDWICTGDIAQGVLGNARRLHALGGGRCLLVAGSMGTGPFEPGEGDETVVLGVAPGSFMDGIHGTEAALANLPADALAKMDAFDPDGVARVVGPLYAWSEAVGGRRLWGGRPEAWRILEDKTTVDALWDAAGVPRAPSAIVPATAEALLAAHADLDAGDGTVWVADNSQGWFGGGANLRWVRTSEEADAAAAWLAQRAESVRVMPFLDGVPCSIHGVVLPDAVVTIRPAEMVVLRDDLGHFHYARAASGWRPPPDDTEAMRAFARAVGAHLRQTVGYRGVFTCDGVLTAEGFRPTELNPRYGAAVPLLLGDTEGVDPYLLHLAIAEGAPLPVSAAELEALLRRWSEGRRRASGLAHIHRPIAGEVAGGLVAAPGGWRWAADGEEPDARAVLGPGPAGGILFVPLAERAVPDGPPAAPVMATLINHLNAAWRLGLPTLSAAPQRR